MTLSSVLPAILLLIGRSDALALGPNASKPKVGRVSAGPLEISSMGCGTWSWGNRLLFDYDPSQDEGIYEAYREIRDAGVTIFDTAGKLDINLLCWLLFLPCTASPITHFNSWQTRTGLST
jgi:hypothetical protein